MMPDLSDLYEVVDHTWPADRRIPCGSWLLRQGCGGGKRVSAATLQHRIDIPDLSISEKGMPELGQNPLFMMRDGDKKRDQMLDGGAYKFVDAVNIYCTSCKSILRSIPPRLSAFDIWEPLEIQKDIWAHGGIDGNRIAVMERADCVETTLLIRWDNYPAGTAYIGIYYGIAMVHALEILELQRRKGVGAIAMRHAAIWSSAQNTPYISVICTKENKAANALYTSLKVHLVGGYHYWIKEEST